jgi:hypothetical protein
MNTNNFSALKQNRQSTLDMINKELDKIASPSSGSEDARFWQPTVDKAGNGSATIRFLPAVEKEDMPFVQVFSHGFKGPTGLWYIENSRTTIKQIDPVSEYNSVLWNKSKDDNSPERKQVRDQKRRLNYISNIYVIKDPSNSENDGKVFLYQYGKKIFDKINEAMHPQFEDEKAFNPFDLWEGANFKLKIRKVDDFRNYDKSEFESVGPLSSSDDEMELIWKKEYPLQEFLDPSKFKPYDELKAKLARVLGADSSAPISKKAEQNAPWDEQETQQAPAQKAAKAPAGATEDTEVDDFFASLAD